MPGSVFTEQVRAIISILAASKHTGVEKMRDGQKAFQICKIFEWVLEERVTVNDIDLTAGKNMQKLSEMIVVFANL